MKDDVKLAHEIAKRAHHDQVDKAGAPYILPLKDCGIVCHER